jgi:LPXTG-motif cell wall-anchored protein
MERHALKTGMLNWIALLGLAITGLGGYIRRRR